MFSLRRINPLFNTKFNFYLSNIESSTLNLGFYTNSVTSYKFLKSKGYKSRDGFISTELSTFNTTLTHLRNTIIGSETGYFIELSLKGIGFKVFHFEPYLFLQLGFSHFYIYKIPSTLIIKAKRDRIVIFGVDKRLVGSIASELYILRIPDAYKAKGVQYKGGIYKLKEGKKK